MAFRIEGAGPGQIVEESYLYGSLGLGSVLDCIHGLCSTCSCCVQTWYDLAQRFGQTDVSSGAALFDGQLSGMVRPLVKPIG